MFDNNKKKTVVLLSRNDFPNGDAGAVRDFTFAKIYQEIGYNVFCICLNKSMEKGEYKQIPFTSIRIERRGIISRLKAEFGYKNRMKSVLKEIEKIYGNIDYFHIVDIPINAIQFLKKYARKNGSILIHDSVEWYSASNFKHGKLSVPYIMKDVLNKYIINKHFKVIAISKYLQTYFSGKGIRTIRIPVIMDTKDITINGDVPNKVLQIVYAGSPGQKDYLKEIILGMGMLPEDYLKHVKLNIIGINKEQLMLTTGLQDKDLLKLASSIEIYGRITREQVMNILREMDFSVLLRPAMERYAIAGFPTKSVESLSSGIPMMCNITSDLGDYLCDMKNAIIIKDCTPEAFIEAVKKAINCSKNEIKSMKQLARETAEQYFDYRNYISVMKTLLK